MFCRFVGTPPLHALYEQPMQRYVCILRMLHLWALRACCMLHCLCMHCLYSGQLSLVASCRSLPMPLPAAPRLLLRRVHDGVSTSRQDGPRCIVMSA